MKPLRPATLTCTLSLVAAIAACEIRGAHAALRMPAEKAVNSFRDCEHCPELVPVPAGSFLMGSPASETEVAGLAPERARAEQPVHSVTIRKAFAIGRNEVTIEEFSVYASESGFEGKGCWTLAAGNWKLNPEANWRAPGFEVQPTSPAVCLSRDDFQGYFDWLSERTGNTYRLPSEAEWEYVAQLAEVGPRIRSAEDAEACTVLNGADQSLKTSLDVRWDYFRCDDGYVLTSPAATFGADRLGLYDLFGNVAEYTADCYYPDHNGAPDDGTARSAEECPIITVKGGSWAGEPGFFRPAFRVTASTRVRGTGFGARVLREIPEPFDTARGNKPTRNNR
jgi:formylglycine-generating enzyme required for sulfatase activity